MTTVINIILRINILDANKYAYNNKTHQIIRKNLFNQPHND
jgi:hypothetical protein